MNLFSKLQVRAAASDPLRIAIIGAGKFASMYLAQVHKTPGVHVSAIIDLNPENAHKSLQRVGWKREQYDARSLDDAMKLDCTWVTDEWQKVVR